MRALPLCLLAATMLARSAWAAPCPAVQLVIDRSASMSYPLGGTTRWQVAQWGVLDFVRLVGASWHVGLTLFPAPGSCGADLAVEPAARAADRIRLALDGAGPSGPDASGSAIRASAPLVHSARTGRPGYLILLADDKPSCGGAPDTPAAAADEIGMAGSPTFVIGFGDGLSATDVSALTAMAARGGRTAPTPERFYRVRSPAEVSAVFSAIIERIAAENLGCSDDAAADGAPPGDGGAGGDAGAGDGGGPGATAAADLGAMSPGRAGADAAGAGGCACSVGVHRASGVGATPLVVLLLLCAAPVRRRRAKEAKVLPERPSAIG